MGIEIRNINMNYGKFQVLKDISLNIPSGELVALLGPSGSGKTTLLRLIAGLESADSGDILFGGVDATNRSVSDRNVGFVFQHYALFKHMTIYENIAFGLRVRPRTSRPTKEVIKNKVNELLKLIQLDDHSSRYPSQLSGGQRQRVALARALAVEPQILLLDEPFGALDAKVRQELRRWVRQLHDKLNITSVFVTHDQEEALEMADKIVVMNEGKIEQVGTPNEVYHHPVNPFVYSFLGRVNLFHGRNDLGHIPHSTTGYVRPHELELTRIPSDTKDIQAMISHIYHVGPLIRIELETLDTKELIEVEMSNERYQQMAPKVNELVFINVRNMKIFI